ncbi:MAG: DUF2085 domain-containing protein [Treponema sp.]|nr:DUF2085 domain-containing protein [Treponema sp.]
MQFSRKTKLWVSLMKLGAKTGCHQMNGRSFSFRGYQFPLCARCTGLLAGQAAGLFLFFLYAKFDLRLLFCAAALSVLPLGIDGAGQLKKLWLSTNARRFFTGTLCGYFVTVFNINAIIALAKTALGKTP